MRRRIFAGSDIVKSFRVAVVLRRVGGEGLRDFSEGDNHITGRHDALQGGKEGVAWADASA